MTEVTLAIALALLLFVAGLLTCGSSGQQAHGPPEGLKVTSAAVLAD